MRYTLVLTILALAFGIAAVPAGAQTSGMSDSDYIAKIKTAAPASVVQGAHIVQMQADGSMKTIQAGTNGFTCMVLPPERSDVRRSERHGLGEGDDVEEPAARRCWIRLYAWRRYRRQQHGPVGEGQDLRTIIGCTPDPTS